MLRIVKSFKDSGSGLDTARLSAAINPALSMLPPSAQVLYCTVLLTPFKERGVGTTKLCNLDNDHNWSDQPVGIEGM